MAIHCDARVLLLALTPGDATLSRAILSEAGLECEVCGNIPDFCRELISGVGAVVVTDDGLASGISAPLAETLSRQPSWSDVPVLLLCGDGADSSIATWAMESLTNVTVLERPIRVTTLISALRTALKARRRQYQLRDQLESLRESEESIRHANERLKLLWETAAILLSTDDPDVMLRELFEKIRPHLQLDIYFNFMVTENGNALQLKSSAGLSAEVAESLRQLELGQAICGTVARERRPIVAARVQDSDDPRAQLIKSLGIRAYACHPLLAGERLLGTLSFASRTRDDFDRHEIAMLQTIAHYVTVVYERMQLISALREDDRRKNEFLATLAHELRNPMAPIRSGLELMEMAGDDRELVDTVRGTMESQIRQMVHLVDDLMDVSRITRGKLVLRKSATDLADAVQSAVEVVGELIRESHHRLEVVLPHEPLILDADPTRLAQVFSNLLTNAAKYTPHSGRICLTAERSDGEAVVRIADNGIGIPVEMRERIFSMFTQVDRSLEWGNGGLGIGLTLVRTLVEMHDGSIEVHSGKEGQGSEFVVRLPLWAKSAPNDSHRLEKTLQSTGRKLRVLVVDDNKDAATTLGMIVEKLGNEVRTAYDGLEALEVGSAFEPDVVLMDLGMPNLNGYDAARRMRREWRGAQCRLVALTGWGQEEDKQKTQDAGFDEHLVKPVEVAVLQRLLVSCEPADGAA